jgi:aminoglycoside N3'-acetyltransferase
VTYAAQSLINYFYKLGIEPGQQLLVHAAFRPLRQLFPDLTPEDVRQALMHILTPEGSMILPTFTYCFKKRDGTHCVYDPENTPAATGILAQTFWQAKDVKRSLSPTHSFGLWGRAAADKQLLDSPASPLGANSVLAWLADQAGSMILFLGTDFHSFSFGHYLEVTTHVPWAGVFPWDHLDVLPVGVSVRGEQSLIQVPGCSGGFTNFQTYLEARDLIHHESLGAIDSMFISVGSVLAHGRTFFRDQNKQLLCAEGTCKACDFRRNACGIT